MSIPLHQRTNTVSMDGVAASPTIILYARHPRPGAVKTRLARDIGNEAASAVYGQLLDHALSELRTIISRMRVVIDAASDEDVSPLRTRAPWVADVRPQIAGDIGERMAHGLARALDEGASCALLVGSDLPGLRAAQLEDAVAHLENADVVFGPARDGGFWLVGLRRPCPTLFSGVRWDAEDVFESALRGARAAGLRCAVTHALDDIDTEADLRSWCVTHPARQPAPALSSILTATNTAISQ